MFTNIFMVDNVLKDINYTNITYRKRVNLNNSYEWINEYKIYTKWHTSISNVFLHPCGKFKIHNMTLYRIANKGNSQ